MELVCDDGYVLPMLLSQRNPDQLLLILFWLVLCERMQFLLAANLVRKGSDASHRCCAVHNTPLQPSSQALGCSFYMGRPLCAICFQSIKSLLHNSPRSNETVVKTMSVVGHGTCVIVALHAGGVQGKNKKWLHMYSFNYC